MNIKHLTSFICGLLVTTAIYGLMIFIAIVTTFSLAGETLSQKENRDSFFFYISVFVIVTTTYMVYIRVKTNRKFSALGIAIPLSFAFYILVLTGTTYFDNINYREAFDQMKWQQSQHKPFKMATTMAKDKMLIGQTKQQIIIKLGATEDTFKNGKIDYLNYWTDKDRWQLRLAFKNDKVTQAYLYEEGLDM